ncbi:MAG: hypothetical protein M9894_34240 [Planctomycetes bacterium]|nr:hypothetical protein [Planctomycetota bacterium]
MRGRLDDEIAAAEREARAGRGDPALLVRLAQLYLRAGRLEPARAALLDARGRLSPVAEGEDGSVDLARLWDEVDDLLQQVERDLAASGRDAQRLDLVARLEGDGLSREEHAELIRLELEAGLPLHPEPARCPACRGALAEDDDGPGVRCARSGRDGDLCRHVDARDLYRCGRCGLVVRAWSAEAQGRLKRLDPHEPPLGRLTRSRCPLCNGPVADWSQHALRCPKRDQGPLPRCPVCRQRGLHARTLSCPRCAGEVATVPCLEGARWPRP